MLASILQKPFVTLLSVSTLINVVHGRVYAGLTELPSRINSFDFIIAGGGTAGSVLASRLSEDTRFNVLLIEAGDDTVDALNLTVPGYFFRNFQGPFDWNYNSTSQSGLDGRAIPVPRGFGLGGSTAINGMVYTRGSQNDYDHWAELTGDPAWSWNALWPYILRHERWTPPAGGRNATGEYDPRVHGFQGNVMTSLPWDDHTEHDLRTIRNAELQSDEFPMVLDLNGGKPIGATWLQSTIGNGTRSSAARAYLGSTVRERPNLTILLNTYVTRVLPIGNSSSSSELEVRIVEVASEAGGSRGTLSARNEVILSAGAIGTPQILLNSGIGNRTELEALGLPSILDLPDVGEKMSEHVAIRLIWDVVPQNTTVEIDEETAFAMWQQNRTGPLTAVFSHHILWSRIPDNSSIWKEYTDPSSGSTSPHVEMFLGKPTDSGFGLLTPHSRGSIKLRSNNPFDDPLIDLGVLTHPFDLEAIKEGIRAMKRFYSGPAWEGYITGFQGPDPDVLSGEDFETAVRTTATTWFHPVGTAQMSKKGERSGVVDPDLRVKGVQGLRVVDASIFPFVFAAHTQAPTYILAERASDLIRDAH